MVEKLVGILMILVIVGSLLIAKPVESAWQEWVAAKSAWEQAKARLNQLERLEADKLILSDQFMQVKNLLVPGEVGAASAAEAMELAAVNNNVNLSITFDDFPEKISIGGAYQLGLLVKVELVGSYQGILGWTAAVEQLPYLLRWEEIKLGPARQTDSIKAEYRGALFFQD